MDLPITFPIILLISAFSIYYDIKERRIPNLPAVCSILSSIKDKIGYVERLRKKKS